MRSRRFPIRPCPVCAGTRSSLLYRQKFERFGGANLMGGYDVVICQSCGAGFADDIPSQSVFDEYYRDLSKYEGASLLSSELLSSEPPTIELRLRNMAQHLTPFIPARDSRILEVGCASGGLIRALKDLGYDNVIGTDPSPGCVRAARELYGVPAFSASVFDLPLPEQPYDFLILGGVMEHIRDLDSAVHQFTRMLSSTGRVYLEVPDAARYDPGLDAPFQEFSIEHINFFSRSSLINLMHARGFRTLHAGHTVRPLHEVTCPCTYGVFEFSGANTAIVPDRETLSGLRAYVQGCSSEDERIRQTIAEALSTTEKIIVWGAGTHTLRLLATEGLNPARIALFVDSNPKYQRQELLGVPIVPPSQLKTREEPILISSRSSQNAIYTHIRSQMQLTNPVILLYGPDRSIGREEAGAALASNPAETN